MKKIVSIILSIMLIFQTTFGATLTVIISGAQITSTREAQEEVELTPKLDKIIGWQVNTGNVTIENNKFIMPNENVEIEAILSEADKYELTVENMYVTTTEEKEEGKDVVVTATSNDEYTFISWTATGITLDTTESRSQTITFTMPGNAVTLTANYMIAVKPDTSGANEPVLGTGMTPVNWNGYEFVDTTETEWQYNYNSVASELSNGKIEGNGDGAWANARTEDGSMWVWIPRYTYKILSGENQTVKSWNSDSIDGTEEVVGKIAVKFSADITDNTDDGYIEHPAFTFGEDDLKGFWVSKYQMSMVDDEGNNDEITDAETGNKSLGPNVKMVSKPGLYRWIYCSASNRFLNSYDYNNTLDSHLIKGNEWGAVVYLTNAIGRTPHSNYGEKAGSLTHEWNTVDGIKASLTHNIYGAYDMAGYWTGISAYCTAGESTYLADDVGKNEYCGALYNAVQTGLSKYVDTYALMFDSTRKGDALYEVSSSDYNNTASWDNSISRMPTWGFPYLSRGYLSIYSVADAGGASGAGDGFRVTLTGIARGN